MACHPMALPLKWHPCILVFNMLHWKHVVVTIVKPKWILQVCQKCSYSGHHMTLECRHYQTLAHFQVHHNVSTLFRAEPKKFWPGAFRLGKALRWPAQDFTLH
jgi:hypothetical protein